MAIFCGESVTLSFPGQENEGALSANERPLSLGTVLAEPVHEDEFHSRIAQVKSLQRWSAATAVMLPFPFMWPLGVGLAIVTFWKSRCFRNSSYRTLINARMNGLDGARGERNDWVARTEAEGSEDYPEEKTPAKSNQCCMTLFAMIGLRAAALLGRIVAIWAAIFAVALVFIAHSVSEAFTESTNLGSPSNFTAECALAENDVCNEPHSCPPGTDFIDCGYVPCPTTDDGYCDEGQGFPDYGCDWESDYNDCHSPTVIPADLAAIIYLMVFMAMLPCCCLCGERTARALSRTLA